jgi:hypothetical protein
MRPITLEEIRRIFERQGLGKEFTEQEPLLLWPRVTGEKMSRLTQPLRVRQGILYVEAANHVVAQQLSLMKDSYLNKLNAFVSEGRVVDVRFRVGDSSRPSREVRDAEQLSLLERERLEQLLDEAKDPDLRKAFESVILALARRDRGRAARGCAQCTVCGIHHDGEGEICYYCRLEGQSP